MAMYRFTTSGAFDTTYSGDGKTLWAIPNSTGTGNQSTYHFDSTAKPWLAAAGPGTTKSVRLYTLNTSGNPDSAFNGDGVATVVLPWNADLDGLWRGGSRLFVTNVASDTSIGIAAVKV
jgi:hypothetical protein